MTRHTRDDVTYRFRTWHRRADGIAIVFECDTAILYEIRTRWCESDPAGAESAHQHARACIAAMSDHWLHWRVRERKSLGQCIRRGFAQQFRSDLAAGVEARRAGRATPAGQGKLL